MVAIGVALGVFFGGIILSVVAIHMKRYVTASSK